ncbi:hypothetical protein GQ457_04G018490 [Hibiscus cannabinus]
MSETILAQNSSSRGSSTERDSVGMETNLPRQAQPRAHVQPQEPIQNLIQPPEPAQAPQNTPDDCSEGMTLEHEGDFQSSFIKLKARSTHCTSVDEALDWWETTILTAPAENVTWKFFIEEFKKKYISEQYLNDRRNRFLHLKQENKPIEQYVAEFCKYCKYGVEYIKPRRKNIESSLMDSMMSLGPMFTTMEITEF